MSLEKIVRPAQSPDNQPPTISRTRRTAVNWQPVVVKYGIGGSIKTANASISQSLTFYHKKRPTESSAGGGSGFGGGLGITFP
jgi:hypothetical protein